MNIRIQKTLSFIENLIRVILEHTSHNTFDLINKDELINKVPDINQDLRQDAKMAYEGLTKNQKIETLSTLFYHMHKVLSETGMPNSDVSIILDNLKIKFKS